MLVLFFVYIFFRTKQCHFECSLHLKKEIDLCKLARQYNEAERLNKDLLKIHLISVKLIIWITVHHKFFITIAIYYS